MDYRLVEIVFDPHPVDLLGKLGLYDDSDEAEDFLALLAKAKPLAKPKAVLGVATVESCDSDGMVVLNGVAFQSRLLAENLQEVETVWPYLATCGRELYDFALSIPDPFERYWVEEIMQQALTDVRKAVSTFLAENVYQGKTAYMSPGSLVEWPIGQQIPLFRMLGDAAEACGVVLTDSLLMVPNKTVSGIHFPNEHGYVSCKLCPREKCPNRRAKFEADMVQM